MLALLTISCTAAGTGGKTALDKPALEAFVRHLLIWGPQIKVTISDPAPSELDGFSLVKVTGKAGGVAQSQMFYVSKDGKKVVRAVVYDVDKNPFHKDFERITVTGQPSLGTPGAPVRMVVFTDFECPFCRQEAESLRANLLKTYPEQVRLYFKDFPLVSIHPWAKLAAITGRCVYRQSEDAFWKYHDFVFAHQTEINAQNARDKLLEHASTLPGVDALQLTRCIDNKETAGAVESSIEEGKALGVNSTPTLFINGRKISQNLPWPNLKQVIDFELNYQKTAKNAGDIDCCAVKLPTPLGK